MNLALMRVCVLISLSVTLLGCIPLPFGPEPKASGPSEEDQNKEDDNDTDHSNIFTNTLTYTQENEKRPLDILFVIDYGTDMSLAQEKLGQNFTALNSKLKNVDWQMAFLNASLGNGLFLPINDEDGAIEEEYVLNPSQKNLKELFKYTISGNAQIQNNTSQPLESIMQAFEQNTSFFRDSASLGVILLTNKGTTITNVSSFLDTIESKLGHNRLIGYGFLANSTGQCDIYNNDPTHYIVKQLVTFTEGIEESLCSSQSEYAVTLKNISQHLKSHLVDIEGTLSIQDEINLSEDHHIIESRIQVTFTPDENSVDYSFDSTTNKLILDEPPELGTQITVTYSYLKDNNDNNDDD